MKHRGNGGKTKGIVQKIKRGARRAECNNGRMIDSMLARLVVSWLSKGRRISHEMRGEEKRGPICLLFSEAGRWYLYSAESNMREQVHYKSSEQKGERHKGM